MISRLYSHCSTDEHQRRQERQHQRLRQWLHYATVSADIRRVGGTEVLRTWTSHHSLARVASHDHIFDRAGRLTSGSDSGRRLERLSGRDHGHEGQEESNDKLHDCCKVADWMNCNSASKCSGD